MRINQAQFTPQKGALVTDLCGAGGQCCYSLANPKVTAALRRQLEQTPAYLYTTKELSHYQDQVRRLAQQFLPAGQVHAQLYNSLPEAWAALQQAWGPMTVFGLNAGAHWLDKDYDHVFGRPVLLNLSELEEVLAQPTNNTKVLVYSPVIDDDLLLTHAEAMPRLLAFCRSTGVKLVAVETWSALGLTGKWVGSSHHPTQPDAYLLNNVITDGLVPAALLGTHQALPPAPPLPLALAAFDALAGQLQQPVVAETITELEAIMRTYARRLHDRQPDFAVQCIGYFLSLLVADPPAVVRHMESEGFVIMHRGQRIALMPLLTISKDQLLKGLEALWRVLGLNE